MPPGPPRELRGVNLVGNLGGDDDRLLSGPNFLLAKLAVFETSDTLEDKNKKCLYNYWPDETKAYMRHIWGGT